MYIYIIYISNTRCFTFFIMQSEIGLHKKKYIKDFFFKKWSHLLVLRTKNKQTFAVSSST